MKKYKMPLFLGWTALLIAFASLIAGIIQYKDRGATADTLFAFILVVAGTLSAINLLRLYYKLKNRKPGNGLSGSADHQDSQPDRAE
jgi:hypothetical protein